MARFRYIAFLARNADALARFYVEHLDFTEIARSADGDVSLTDGFYNFTFLAMRPGLSEPRQEPGLHHVGIEVDSIDDTVARWRDRMPGWQSVPEPGGPHRGEYRIYDPEALPISLSETGFGVTGEDHRAPRLAHIALNSVNTDAMLDFYKTVFGMRELRTTEQRRQQGRLNRFVGDGFTNLAIHPFHSDRPGHEARYGVNHVGYLVSDMDRRLETFSKVIEVAKRPDDRPYAEYRLRDPEGNGFDLSMTKGWEVDIDKWESAA